VRKPLACNGLRPVGCLAIAPASSNLFALEAGLDPSSSKQTTTLELWDLQTGTAKNQFDGVAKGKPLSFALSPDGLLAALATDQGWAGVVNAQTGKEKWQKRFGRKEPEALPVAFSPDGQWLAVAAQYSGFVELVVPETGEQPRSLPGLNSRVHSLAFSPDGKLLAAGGGQLDGVVQLWDLETGKGRRNLTAHKNPLSVAGNVHAVAFSPDGRLLASAGDDGLVKLWSVAELVKTSSE
jgi:WD40 repeat protein